VRHILSKLNLSSRVEARGVRGGGAQRRLIDAQVGSIVFNGSTNTFNAGSRFGGAGQVLHTGAGVFNGSFQSDSFVHAAGSLTGNDALLSGGVAGPSGAMGWTGGDLAGEWTIAAGSTLSASGAAVRRQVGSKITNQGTLRWDTTATLQGGNASVLTNHGLIEARQSATIQWNYGGQATLTHAASGTISATNGAVLTLGNLALTSNGGLFNADAGSAIVYAGASNRFNDGTRFVGEHRMEGQSRYVDKIQSDNLRWISGTQTGGDGVTPGSTASFAGQVSWEGGDVQGAFEILAGATLNASGAAVKRQVGSSITNNGTLRWDTTATLQGGNSSVLNNHGLIEARQSATIQWNYGGQATLTHAASGTISATNGAVLTLGNLALTSDGGLFNADAGSAIVYAGASNRFNDGTRFVGEHRMEGQSRYVDKIQSDNLRWISGTQTGGDGVTPGSTASFAGQVSWEGGDVQGAFEILAGATLNASGAAVKRQVGSSITNNGTLRWDTTATLQGGNSSVLNNHGLIEARQSATLQWNYGGQASLTHAASGTVSATNGAVLTLGNLALTSDGGLFNADAGSAIVYAGASNRFNDGTRFVGEHRMEGQSRYVDKIQSDNLRWISGTQTGGDGVTPGSTASFAGQVSWEGGDVQGAFEILAGATLNASGAAVKRQVGSSITNNGTLRWDTTATLQGGNSSVFTNNGRFDMMADAALQWNYGGQASLVNHGLFIKTGGAGSSSLSGLALTNHGTIDVRSGSIALPANFTNNGTLAGTGAFAVSGTLTNAGHMAPGASPGTLTLNGSYAQTAAGSFDVELEGLPSHDLLLVNGNAALDGTLALACFSLCNFAVDDEVVILDATGALSGSFSSVTLSGFGTGAFDVVYDLAEDRVVLRITEAVTAAVPEPGTYALMVGGLAALAGLARRRRRAFV
jgi:fibronectin-binding autotransporter adhesin